MNKAHRRGEKSRDVQLGWCRTHSSPVAAVTLAAFAWTYLQPALAWAVEDGSRALQSRVGADQLAAMREAAPVGASANSDTASVQEQVAPSAEQSFRTPSLGAAIDARRNELAQSVPALQSDALQSDVSGFATTSLPKADNGVSSQAIAMPSGAATVGGMGESFSAQLSTGIATFKIALATPPGRGVADVTLKLVYGSSGGAGLAGTGWSLGGAAAISRQTHRGTPKYDDRSDWHPEQDRFLFGAEELVPICKVDAGTCQGALANEVMPVWANGWQYFRARVEGSFMRFFWSPDHLTWRVQSKSGAQLELGRPLDGTDYAMALERNPQKPSEVYRWHLVRHYDSHGQPNATPLPQPANLVLYRYVQDGGAAYLSDVYYTPPAALPLDASLPKFAHHVGFTYEARNDPSTTYVPGWAVQQRLRLKRVDVASKPFTGGPTAPRELVRRYHLTYDAASHHSLLTSFQLEGRCSAPVLEDAQGRLPTTNCPRLPASTFEYQCVVSAEQGPTDSNGFRFEPVDRVLRRIENSPPHSLDESDTSLFDINSDSLPDVLVTAPASYGGRHGLFLNQGARSGQPSFAAPSRMSVVGATGVDAGVLRLSNVNVAGLDVDGSASADLLHMPRARRYQVFSTQRQGDGFAWVGRTITTASGQDTKIDFTQSARRTSVMDVNGDGLVDVVFAGATEYQTFFSLGRYPGGDGQFGQARMTSASTAELLNAPVTSCLPWSAEPVRLGDVDVRIADMNADGLPDLVRLRDGQIFYWPGRGNGYWGTGDRSACKAGQFGKEQHVSMLQAPRYGTTQPGSLQLADVNGDGLADLVEVRAQAVDVYLNDAGTSFTARYTLSNVPFVTAGSNPVRLVDVNGSGSSDVLWGQAGNYQYIDLTGGVRPHLLTRLHNGLGKSTELEYRTSSELMVEAARQNRPWSSVMPMSTPVVVRLTTRDNLEKLGRRAGRYVTEYTYRDPVYEGRQREFRGFRSAEVRSVGDAHQPTSTTRSTHLLGECVPDEFDSCEPRDRWKDAWREPLKGLAVLSESFDQLGVYVTSTQSSFELRQLYSGRDGRRVSVAFATGNNVFGYDTAAFVPAEATVPLQALQFNLNGINRTETFAVPKRASAGTVRQRTQRVFDNYGNVVQSTSFGCVEGCVPVDDAITRHAEHALPTGDTSGWLFRETRNFVTSVASPARRHEFIQAWNAAGDRVSRSAVLSGTLPLVRSHAAGRPVAPPPVNASAGVTSPATIVLGTTDYNDFGNVTVARGAHGRCTEIGYDADYSEFPITEKVFAGTITGTGCGDRELVTRAQYDRGMAAVVRGESVTGQPSRYELDGFGRLVAEYRVNPDTPGVLGTLPSARYQYFLPNNAATSPYTVVVARTQDGASVSDDAYHQRISYVDGLGRTILLLSEADTGAGDSGQYVVGGQVTYDARGAVERAYTSAFWSGDPLQYPLGQAPTTPFTSTQLDAFGRSVASYGLDGEIKAYTEYHALSADLWDAEDLKQGTHAGTYATSRADGHGRSIESVERVRVSGTLEQRVTLHEYLPTGELSRITVRRAGSPDIVRWLRYDSLGRAVLNVEPNTSPTFTANAAADPSTLRAHRYAYNDLGQLVGTSDARGCGINFHFDAAGRKIGEDYSPCLAHHADYTAPDLATGNGFEAFTRYDLADPDATGLVDENGVAFATNAALLRGKAVSVADRGSKGLIRLDARGRVTGTALRVQKPHAQSATPAAIANRFAPRWYTKTQTFDSADRSVTSSSGARTAELMGTGGKSTITRQYSNRGLLKRITSSYGVLLDSHVTDANGLVRGLVLGDRAQTQRTFTYDVQQRLQSVQTYRGTPELWSAPGYSTPTPGQPTQQLLIEDLDFAYDAVDNVTSITDWRTPTEWPAQAQPVTRRFEYDNSYRLTRTVHEYASGSAWQSPFHAENTGQGDPAAAKPSPHVAYDQRVLEQRFEYDHLGNTTRTTDDANGFFDRSLGTTTQGSAASGPHQLRSASNRALAPTSTRKGDLSAAYDEAGNLSELIVRRDGACLPAASSCWQRFRYEWDEVGQLSKAVRYDLSAGTERTSHATLGSALPSRAANAELRYAYDSGGTRVLKTAVDAAGQQSHTVYVFDGLELRQTWWTAVGTSPQDYALTPATEHVLLRAGPATARVLYAFQDLPTATSGRQHTFLQLNNHLGSTSAIIDHGTGELVEYATYQAYGAFDADYRPGRWGSFREPYKFTGKEEDIEVGLQYFGARYLSVGLGRWISPDPVALHQLGSDPNLYAYVKGRPTVAVDPDGRELITLAVVLTAVAIGAAIGAATAATVYTATNWDDWELEEFAISAGIGALSGAVSAGVGSAVGGATAALITSQATASILGGAVGGAVGSTAGYATSSALTGQKMSWVGVGTAFGIGAVTGAVSGYLNRTPSGPAKTGESIPTTDRTFATREDAAEWLSGRFHERAVAHDQEFKVWMIDRPEGGVRISAATAGEPKTGLVKAPLPELAPGEKISGAWHPHPKGGGFSETYVEPDGTLSGDEPSLSAGVDYNPEYRSYLSSEGRMFSTGADDLSESWKGGYWGKDLGPIQQYYRPGVAISAGFSATAGAGVGWGAGALWNKYQEQQKQVR